MKIAVVVTGGLHPSGRDQVVPSWLALFSELARTHDIHAFALRHLPEAQTYPLLGFTVHDLGRPSAPFGLTRWAQARALTRALSAHGPFDLIHGLWGDPAGQLAARSARAIRHPKPGHDGQRRIRVDPGHRLRIAADRAGPQAIQEACGASRIHVCTQFMANLAAQHGVQPTVIPLTSVPSGAPQADADDPTPRRPLTLVQVASLSRVKNQQMLIDALAIVRQSIDARLDLVGEDTLGGELQRHAVAKRRRRSRAVPRVRAAGSTRSDLR